MTYQELYDLIAKMTPRQRGMAVVTYSGDIDAAIPVIGTSLNTEYAMGDSLPGYPTTQTFLVLE